MLLIGVLVKTTSKGPVIFRQERVGLNNVPFTILKFRTMHIGLDDASHRVIAREDKHITTVGRFLRSTHLDEIPQLVNVFKGEMSLVGPRPLRMVEVNFWRERIPNFNKRHAVRPGLTGSVQISGRTLAQRSGEDVFLLDLSYVRENSFLGDMRIIAQTLPVILKRNGI